ncbi:hypothetical protein GGS24DRAFT_498605 [Hypoxylon argillaceum]|nr:hypothetical protein GGS24DRAFT_498605 [Hypoxylon argillaceum]
MSTPNQETPDPRPDDTSIPAQVDQVLSGKIYSTGKLQLVLVRLFGDGGYDLHVEHNNFRIKTPRRLTKDELIECER